MGNYQVKGNHHWPTSCMPGLSREAELEQNEGESDGEEEETQLCTSTELENAIINDDSDHLQQLIKTGADINTPLTEKGETALILSVKLSHLKLVEVLLSQSTCKKNCLNHNNFSALDLAMITAFDNRLEPRHTIAWQIIKCLMEAKSEPVCRDAMMYVVRTALKDSDEDFLYRLIEVAKTSSQSFKLHELLLQKLHRHQPIYGDMIDPLLIRTCDFSIKLIKFGMKSNLEYVVNSLVYYLESYWHSKESQMRILQKLILYASAAGWVWTQQQVAHITQLDQSVSSWCSRQTQSPPSLNHLARLSFRHNLPSDMITGISGLPYVLPESVKSYLLLGDVDNVVAEQVHIKDINL